MTKTFDKLLEDISDVVVPTGMKPNGIQSHQLDDYTIKHLRKFAKQISDAFQPDLPQLLARIETELNKFAYTLGQLDLDGAEEEDGADEDFVIFEKATKQMVKNAYINLNWEKLASGQTDANRPEGSALKISVEMTLEEVTDEEFKEIVGGADNADTGASEPVIDSGM